MMDFSSGWGTSTSNGRSGKNGKSFPQVVFKIKKSLYLQRNRVYIGTSVNGPCPTLWVQQTRHSQVSLRHTKGLLQVLQVGLSVHSAHVDESGTGEHKNGQFVHDSNLKFVCTK